MSGGNIIFWYKRGRTATHEKAWEAVVRSRELSEVVSQHALHSGASSVAFAHGADAEVVHVIGRLLREKVACYACGLCGELELV